MISELFSSLAAPVFAAVLFLFFLKSRSREINGGEASSNAARNDGTAGGASSTHSSTGVPETATSAGPAKDAAATDGTAGGDSGAHSSTGVPENEMATTSGTAGGASGTHTSTEGDGTATCEYEVFLSFRGPDTRAGITNYLYTGLTDLGICTFKDDEDLREGEEFAPKLLRAIMQSKILVPIFSKNYASSVWCLKEAAQMVECTKIEGRKIVPIFYDVAPVEVRYQTGGYKEAFLLHEKKKRRDEKTIGEWKAALSAVGEIKGWDLHKEGENRREGEFVKKFLRRVFNELKKASLVVSDNFVGVDKHVDAIMEKIGTKTSETRIIGIHGMGGIGKTTIAKVIYNKFSHDFENCCFLGDVRERSKGNGIQCLQKQLISNILKRECTDINDIHEGIQTIKVMLSNKRVLLLLDDVEEANHIDALVCKRDWLGKGSKIIITSRRIDVLKVPEVDDRYELTGMNRDQSLQLLSKHAFRRDSPSDEYINQSNRAIDIAGGLPLALEVIGSLLYCTKKEMWEATLKMLESVPHDKIQSKPKISYDALNLRQQHMFLDIACFFIGYDKDILVLFRDEPNFYPEVAMEDLHNKSLIKINEDNEVWMHDLLRDLGREMVREKSCMNIEKQSRVWDHKQGFDLLRKHKGNKEVEALRLKLDNQRQYRFTYEGFESLSDLRFLEVDGYMGDFLAEDRLLWHKSSSNVLPANVFEENSNLLPHLRWLSWHHILPTFKITHFSLEDMVFLDLSFSKITHNWKGWSHMKAMKNLKVLNLSYCQHLERTPNLSAHANLERLILNYCRRLGEIDGSICRLKRLVFFSVHGCEELQRLPDEVGNLESLIELDIAETKIKEPPDSIGNLKNLKILEMRDTSIRTIPDVLWKIEKLEEIGVKIFYRDPVDIDNCIYRNRSLKILKLEDFEIYAVPKLPESLVTLYLHWLHIFPDLSNLTNLRELDLEFCSRDSDEESDGLLGNPMPRWIANLRKQESLRLTTSPADLTLPPHLKSLRLKSCHNLRRLPRLPSSLSSLRLEHCNSLCSMEDLSNLKNLSSLYISFAAIEEIQGLGCLENLRDLELRSLGQVKILPDLSNLNKLRSLLVYNCGNLVEIQGQLPRFLDKLHISCCDSLQNLPDLSCLMGKQHVEIQRCSQLNAKAFLGFTRLNQRDLRLSGFGQLQILPDLSNSSELRSLQVRHCPNLVEIQGELPESLQELEIDSCGSLRKLPDLSSLMGQGKVRITGCRKLNLGEDDEHEYESEGVVVKDESESEGEDNESESHSEGEDHESEYDF
ncbi:disease resistance protein RUN1-like [Rhodamnia argentea]|uniref:Disease resistance protein RUN1-like n=1 Tax=Rhodamnia argentea TaxID=178133 RepID=A0ABM3GYC7_9MYRT|nr:disease resistance protein RUN1-like [Rhodamnia argentea]